MRSTAFTCLLTCALLAGASGCRTAKQETRRAEANEKLAEVSLKLTDLEGEPLDLDAELAAGRSVALVFWQTACPSCKREAPKIVAAQAAEQGKITFVGVVPGATKIAAPEAVRARRKEWGYEAFPQVLDPDESLTQALAVKATPTVVVIGPKRQVLYHDHVAPRDWSRLRGAQ